MKTGLPMRPSRVAGLAGAAMLLGAGAPNVPGQLAITEVMSWASTNLGPNWVENGSDFWELSNLGANTIRLNGYTFTDRLNAPIVPLVAPGDPDLFIGPNESIVFVRTDETTNELHFRAWWGPCLPATVQVRMYPRSPGFDSQLDGVRLYDATGALVDQVDFGMARRGVTFVYDTNSGAFGTYSVWGECGACKAATADDIGSPGRHCGPVPLLILECPVSQTACAGTETVFSVRAGGLPRPRFQWQHDGTNLPGATAASLILTNVGPADAGRYDVEISNGSTLLRCTNIWLTVSTNRSPPVVLAPPVNAELYAGQNAKFAVTVCAYPPASYQWFSNNVEVTGATNRILRIENCTRQMSGTVYCVRAANALGTNTACARLVVTHKPKLRFTEVMASASTNCSENQDWLEITNLDTNRFNLLGYRLSDVFDLAGARVITQAVVLLPGESMILVEQMSAEAFINWWGADNLPPDLQIIRYVGLGFSALGDDMYLWNAAAEDAADLVDSKSYAGALPGVSVYFSESGSCPDGGLSIFGCDSEARGAGAFRAVSCGDVGSPGWTPGAIHGPVFQPLPPWWVTLTGVAPSGSTNVLLYRTNLQDAAWLTTAHFTSSNETWSVTDTNVGAAPHRFYRLRTEEPLPERVLRTNHIDSLVWVPMYVNLTWWAPPFTTNLVFYTTNRAEEVWIPIGRYTSPGARRTLTDTNAWPTTPRFYRVIAAGNQPDSNPYDRP